MFIELKDIEKIYNRGEVNEVRALHGVNMVVDQGEMICLRGPSGSGKTTLLSLIGCVFPPTRGRATIYDKKISRLPDRFLTFHRRKTIGFIFQHLHLFPEMSVEENVCLPLIPLGISPRERKKRAAPLLERLSIAHRAQFPAKQISGGELQRTAIARALIHDPPLLLADEPTAHLDSRLSDEFMTIVQGLKEEGRTVLLTSHDPLVTEHGAVDRVFDMLDGTIVAQSRVPGEKG